MNNKELSIEQAEITRIYNVLVKAKVLDQDRLHTMCLDRSILNVGHCGVRTYETLRKLVGLGPTPKEPEDRKLRSEIRGLQLKLARLRTKLEET